jgi:hypothetical protein
MKPIFEECFTKNEKNAKARSKLRITVSSVLEWTKGLLELAFLGKLIQRGSENNVNKVSIRGGNSSVNLASQGHCAGVFIGT